MAAPVLFSIVDSPTHPNFSTLYRKLGFEEVRLPSARKAMSRMKRQVPEVLVAEFRYGYGNNYAGVNVCNLDVTLSTLEKYAPEAAIVVFVHRSEQEHVEKLHALFPLYAVLTYPATEAMMTAALSDLGRGD